jgi:ATP-dependent DNA ligase
MREPRWCVAPQNSRRLLCRRTAGRGFRASGFIDPCIPTRAHKPPAGAKALAFSSNTDSHIGPDWVHEIKHDGYRLQVRRAGAGDAVRLFTRRGYDWSGRYPAITPHCDAVARRFIHP